MNLSFSKLKSKYSVKKVAFSHVNFVKYDYQRK